MVAWGTILRGWALAMQGQGGGGITQIRQGLPPWRTGAELERLHISCTQLAETYGNWDTRRRTPSLAEALTLGRDNTGSVYEADMYRLRGACAAGEQQTTADAVVEGEAETCFTRPWKWPAASRRNPWSCGRHEPRPPVAAAGQTR